jgi:hypothetical protein
MLAGDASMSSSITSMQMFFFYNNSNANGYTGNLCVPWQGV